MLFAAGNLLNRPPPSLPLHRGEKVASWVAHKLLYLSVLAVPLAGYLMTTADGNGLDLFGWLTLPSLTAPDETLRDVATIVHIWGAYSLLVLAAVHGAGALKHHLIDRDRTLLWMIRGQ